MPIETHTPNPLASESDRPLRNVVVDRHSYIRHGNGAEELYDLQADPAEKSNLIASGNEELRNRCREVTSAAFAFTGHSREGTSQASAAEYSRSIALDDDTGSSSWFDLGGVKGGISGFPRC